MKRILTTLNEKYFIPQLYSTITICHVSFYIYMIKVKNGKKKKMTYGNMSYYYLFLSVNSGKEFYYDTYCNVFFFFFFLLFLIYIKDRILLCFLITKFSSFYCRNFQINGGLRKDLSTPHNQCCSSRYSFLCHCKTQHHSRGNRR